MWLMTKHGFYSIVEKKPGKFHIRSRERRDLQNLLDRVPLDGEKIVDTPDADYGARIITGRDKVRVVLAFGPADASPASIPPPPRPPTSLLRSISSSGTSNPAPNSSSSGTGVIGWSSSADPMAVPASPNALAISSARDDTVEGS